jgi:ABC-type Fe3+-hydroxamate transport system substrate-binding protein
MKPKNILLFLTTLLILLLLVACSKNQATTSSTGNTITTQEPLTATQQTSVEVSQPEGVPEDVPIMPDAYDLEVTNQLNLNYKINLPIKDVVAFYQQELPNNGWDQINNPDSVVGSMAQMSRSKANGDRINFSFQYNPIGEFTVVQIYITRVP